MPWCSSLHPTAARRPASASPPNRRQPWRSSRRWRFRQIVLLGSMRLRFATASAAMSRSRARSMPPWLRATTLPTSAWSAPACGRRTGSKSFPSRDVRRPADNRHRLRRAANRRRRLSRWGKLVTALNDSLVLAAELGKVAAGIERELRQRCDRQDSRMLELLDRLAKAEKTIADLTRRVRAAERAQRPPRSTPAAIRAA